MEVGTQADTQSRGLSIPTGVAVAVFVVAGTSLHIWLHRRTHGVYDPTQISLAFFLIVNLMITWWEISLFVCQDQIQAEYEALREPYRGREMEAVKAFFFRPVPVFHLLSLSEWTGVWSTYSLFDPGYSDRRSFGYNIDVGNGYTTLIPATLFAFGMTFHFAPARVLGILGVIIFWQMFYGTTVYFFQFFNNDRHKGHSARDILLFVGVSNVLWWVFPLLGLVTSIRLILDGSYAVFL